MYVGIGGFSSWRAMNQPLASASSRHLVTIPMPLASLGVRMTLAPRKRINLRRSTEKVSTMTETRDTLCRTDHCETNAGVPEIGFDYRLTRLQF